MLLTNLMNRKYFFIKNMIQFRYYTIRRDVIYTPGDDTRKIKKATQLDADCIVLDCEDGVAIKRKMHARQTIRNFFDTKSDPDIIKTQQRSTEWAVRVNSIDSNLLTDDIKEIFSGEENRQPSTIFLPKVNSIEHVKIFSDCLKKCTNKPKNQKSLIFYAESCIAIMNLPAICEAMFNESKNNGYFIPVGIVFGSDDFCASLGATRTIDSSELLYARQRLVLIAKAYQLQAIDMVHIEYKDLIGLKTQCEIGSKMGYTGKQVIHPNQIEIVQKEFLPSAKTIQWANELMEAFYEHQKNGMGVFVYNNSMIDMPTVKQAQNILEIMKNVQ